MRRAIAVAVAFLLAACSGGGEHPGATTDDEARQLNEAATMLDVGRIDRNAVTAGNAMNRN